MASVLAVLKEIHQYQLELADVRDQLKRGPQQVTAKQADLKRREDALAIEKDAVRKMRVAADTQELQLKSNEQRILDLKVKQNQCKSNKEYATIQDEINRLGGENSLLADQILEAIGAYEAKSAEHEANKKACKATLADFEKFKGTVAYQEEKLTSRINLLEGKITELEKAIDDDTRAIYMRMVKAKGHKAMAETDSDSCSACYTSLTPQAANDIRAGRAVLCKSCGALLYA